MNALLIEDDRADAVIFERMWLGIRSDNDKLRHVESLGEALHVLGRSEPDIILLDLKLPDSTGIEGIGKVLGCAPRSPVIVLTSTRDQVIALASLRVGAEDYLIKGEFDRLQLERSIRYAIERRRLREALHERNRELQAALDEVHSLQGMIPMCAQCKRIRDDAGFWNAVEKYIQDRSGAKFSHGYCPDCAVALRVQPVNESV